MTTDPMECRAQFDHYPIASGDQRVITDRASVMLTSLQNPLVKQLRKLHRAKERHRQNRYLLEGTHLIEVAGMANHPLEIVCCTPHWQRCYPQLWELAQHQATRVELVSEEVLQAIATTTHPDGVIATALRSQRIMPQLSQLRLGLVVERLQDPGNLGTMIRTAAGVGADGLWLSDHSVDFDHPKVLRASSGEGLRLPMTICPNLLSFLKAARSHHIQMVATVPSASQLYWQVDWTQPSLILLGNEGSGLSDELIAYADCTATLPLAAGVESLNVAIAAAVLLYEAKRQRTINQESP